MKKLFTLLFAAGIAAGATAQTGESVTIRKTDESKMAISFPETPKSTVFVKISDADNHLVYRDRIGSSEAFSKKYDLSALPEGSYSIEVSDNTGLISSSTIENFTEEKPVVYSRVSKVKNNTYRLLVSKLDQKDVEIMIFDGGNLIHTEKVENPQGMHKIFTIEQPSSEGISFKVKTSSGFESFVSSL